MDHLEPLAKAAVFRGRFEASADKDQETKRVIASACAIVGSDTEEDVAGTISVERPVEFDYSHDGAPLMTVSCKIDRLLVKPDQAKTLYLRDYKFTARRKISLAEAFIYLWSAKKAFTGRGFEQFALEYEFCTPENEVTRETVTGADVRGQFALVTEAAAKVIRGTEYPAVAGEACTYCPLRAACQGLAPESGNTGEEIF